VLSSEFERDPARGAFPGQRPPTHEPLSHLELVGNADLYLNRSSFGEHARESLPTGWPTTC